MIRNLALICAVCLTACAKADLVVPPELLQRVSVTCQTGNLEVHLGRCAIALRQGLDTANSKIEAVGRLYAESQK